MRGIDKHAHLMTDTDYDINAHLNKVLITNAHQYRTVQHVTDPSPCLNISLGDAVCCCVLSQTATLTIMEKRCIQQLTRV